MQELATCSVSADSRVGFLTRGSGQKAVTFVRAELWFGIHPCRLQLCSIMMRTHMVNKRSEKAKTFKRAVKSM